LLRAALWSCGFTKVTASDGSCYVYVSKAYTGTKRSLERPILVFHGIGIGLLPYMTLAVWLSWTLKRPLVLVEVPGVAMQWTRAPPPTPTALVEVITRAWRAWEIPPATVVGHSLGTVFASWLIKAGTVAPTPTDKFPQVLDSVVFLDPICFGLFWSDIAANFVYRSPHSWTHIMMRYFAGRDINIAHYLYRHFWWYEQSLFPLDCACFYREGKWRMAVVLAEADAVVHSSVVRRYLDEHGLGELTVVLNGIGHGGILLDPRWWLQVKERVELVSHVDSAN
jgi:pimeloyl-ACP methyl ester carboxylesterase